MPHMAVAPSSETLRATEPSVSSRVHATWRNATRDPPSRRWRSPKPQRPYRVACAVPGHGSSLAATASTDRHGVRAAADPAGGRWEPTPGEESGCAARAALAPVGGVRESGTPRDPARTVTTMSGGTVRPSWSASSYKRSLTWAAACVLAVAAPTPTRALAAPVTGGTVVGWGANGAGAAQPPAELDDVAAVAAGKVHSLALRADGTVQAWGDAFYGGRTPPGLSDVTAIAASDTHTLYLQGDGSITGAGWNGYGALQPPSDLGAATAVAAGSGFSLALTADGRVVGWGNDYYHQASPPDGLSAVTAIAAGSTHGLALRHDGTVVGWGANSDGQATPPPDLRDVIAIAAGGRHSLALRSDGTVVGWGANRFGQATPPEGLRDVTAIAAGGSYSLALRKDGTVAGWGGDQYDWGEAGEPPILGTRVPGPPEGLVGVVSIAAGAHHALAVVGAPQQQVLSLRQVVRGMDLPAATRRLLARPLHAAGGALRDGRDAAAVRALERFRDDVVQPLADGALSEQREAFLHAAAGRILAALQAPTESDLGTLGGATSRATAVNGRGMVVGDSTTADGETHGFIWRDGVMTDLGTLGGASSTAAAVNASGAVAGESRTADGDLHAFLCRDGEMVDLGPAGGTSHAVAINSAGVVVGTAQTGEQNQSRAVRWCQMRLQFLDVSRAGAAGDGK